MNRKFLLPFLILVVLALYSGGTDAIDINRMIFVTGIGIDSGQSGYRYTFYTAVPVGSDTAVSENNVEYQSTSIDAESLASAMRQLEQGSSRDISLEHLGCTALGRSAVDKDIRSMTDFLLRDPSVRRKSVVFALDSSAEDFFSTPFNGSIASAASSALEQLDDSDSRSSLMTLGRLDGTLDSTGGYSLYVLGLGVPESEASGSDVSGARSIELRGLAVYNTKGLGGILERDDAELSRLFTHGQLSGLITSADINGDNCFYEVTYATCELDFQPDDPCRASIDIRAQCVLVDSGGKSSNLPDEAELSSDLSRKLNRLIEQSRSCGSAVTGLETEARQSHRLWFESIKESWDAIYRRTNIDLVVSCIIEQRSRL